MDGTSLEGLRDRLDRLLLVSADPRTREQVMSDVVTTAYQCELAGGEYDLRRFAGTLSAAIEYAGERNDVPSIEGYAAHLMAVLSDIADLGDEDAAIGLNKSMGQLPIHLIEAGKHCMVMRREAQRG